MSGARPGYVAPAHGADDDVALVARDLHKAFTVRRPLAQVVRAPFARSWRRALQGVSLEVAPGECLGVLGPNGAGKTTLFRILTTLIAPDAGEAQVFGRDVLHEPDAVRRLIAYASADERSLYWRLDARENVRVFLALYGRHGAQARAAGDEALAAVGLDPASSQPAGTFSSGMRQRLLLARALATRPRLLLLDEPTRSLDPVTARDFRQFLRDEVIVRAGCTVVLATHSGDEASMLCARVAVLDRGRVLALEATSRLAERIAGGRYRLWTETPAHSALAALAVRVAGAPEDGWTPVELTLSGGDAALSAHLAHLVMQGVAVSRVERVPVGLADIIEGIVREDRREALPELQHA